MNLTTRPYSVRLFRERVFEGVRSIAAPRFILRGAVAVTRDVGKPEGDEMMSEACRWHPRFC